MGAEIIQLVEAKTCRECGLMKRTGPGGDFYRCGDGWQSRCKACEGAGRSKRMHRAIENAPPWEPGTPATTEQIAQRMKITTSRVLQIEKQALCKLRRRGSQREFTS